METYTLDKRLLIDMKKGVQFTLKKLVNVEQTTQRLQKMGLMWCPTPSLYSALLSKRPDNMTT